jgi:hypothetical protein
LKECNIINDSVISAIEIEHESKTTNSQRGHPSSMNRDKKNIPIWQERSASRSPEGYDRQFNANMYRA